MDTAHSDDGASTTLGFFLHGIPAVYVQTEIQFSINRTMSDYVTSAVEGRAVDFSKRRTAEAYELFVTPLHELRHFHDALLSPALFKLFIQHSARLLLLLRLPEFLTDLNPHDLPFVKGKPIPQGINPSASAIIHLIHELDIAYGQEAKVLHKHQTFLGGIPISITHLLEANAVASELFHLIVSHGSTAAECYYAEVIRGLPPVYNILLNTFASIEPDFSRALIALHLAVSHSLYTSEDPVGAFCQFANEYKASLDGFFERHCPPTISRQVRDDRSLEKYIDNLKINRIELGASRPNPAIMGMEAPEPKEGGPWPKWEAFPRLMYDIRSALAAKYLDEFQMDSNKYFRRTDEMPLPPVVFWPSRIGNIGEVVCISESILGKLGYEWYTIRAGSEADTVVAGISHWMLRRKSFLNFGFVDVLMLAYYWYCLLFSDKPSVLYHTAIDEVYLDIFRKSFGWMPKATS